MKERVVFLHYHGTGHINPCIPLAHILRKEGHQVHFAGVEFFHHYVISLGFPHYVLKAVPFGLGFETWVNTVEKRKNIYLSTLRDRATDRLYALREAALLKMIRDLQPDVIFLDGTQPTDFIVLYPFLKRSAIKVAMIHAMFPTHALPGRPPVNSDALPENEEQVKEAIRQMNQQQLRKALKQKIKYIGFNDRFIINRRLNRNKIPPHFRSSIPSLFNFNVQGIPEFILAPREYDFPDFAVAPLHYYVGFLPVPSSSIPSHPDFTKAWSIIHEKKQTEGRKLIYCAFGTIESDEQSLIQSLLEKIAAISHKKGFLLIVSITMQSVNVSSLASDNIYIFKTVPQTHVLNYTDVFITHGGLSSVKESIFAEVPMLMYPVHNDFDPRGNAARVAYHGMGLRGSAQSDSEGEIENKIQTLLTDQIFRDRIIEMKRINSTYTAEKFLARFNTIPALPSE